MLTEVQLQHRDYFYINFEGKPTNNSDEYVDTNGAGFYHSDLSDHELQSLIALELPNPWLVIDSESDHWMWAVKFFTRWQESESNVKNVVDL